MFAPLAADEEGGGSKLAEEEEPVQSLPLLDPRERITCAEVSIADRHTAPPKRFTEASLIHAMTGVARYVHDPKIKKLLRETDGIGRWRRRQRSSRPSSIAASSRSAGGRSRQAVSAARSSRFYPTSPPVPT